MSSIFLPGSSLSWAINNSLSSGSAQSIRIWRVPSLAAPLSKPQDRRPVSRVMRSGVPDNSAGTRSAQTRMSIFLDDTIAACSFQPAAQLCGLFRRRKGADKSPIVNARGTKIGAANDRLAAAELIGVLRLQRSKSGLSLAFTCPALQMKMSATSSRSN